MTPIVVAVLAALAMEPAVALVHRLVMHRGGWVWHRSHHQRAGQVLEANDLFPVVFAGLTIAAMAVGAAVEPLVPLLWIGSGVTAYGAAYLVVHDLYIHERLGRMPGAGTWLVRRLADAHQIHHRFGRAPYGFLVPVVPRDLRARTERHAGDAMVPPPGPLAGAGTAGVRTPAEAS